MGWFLVDKLGAGGLDDLEVKIADFVVLLGFRPPLKVGVLVFDATN